MATRESVRELLLQLQAQIQGEIAPGSFDSLTEYAANKADELIEEWGYDLTDSDLMGDDMEGNAKLCLALAVMLVQPIEWHDTQDGPFYDSDEAREQI